jgi:hypothetical protein
MEDAVSLGVDGGALGFAQVSGRYLLGRAGFRIGGMSPVWHRILPLAGEPEVR